MSGTPRPWPPTADREPRGRSTARHSRGALTVVFFTVVCFVLVAAVFAVWDGRLSTIREYEDRHSRLGLVLAEQTNRALQAVDVVLQATSDQIKSNRWDSEQALTVGAATEELNRDLRQKLNNLPQLEALTVMDLTGRIINTSRRWPVGFVQLPDRDYLTHFRQSDDDGTFLSKPYKSALTGQWTMLLARRIATPAGRTIGAVTAAISLRYFDAFFQSIDQDNTEIITLLRRDGTLLVLHPNIDDAVGGSLPLGSPWFKAVAAGGGAYTSRGVVSGANRFTVVHPLRDYPLVINVGVIESIAMASWRRETALISLASVLVIGILVALFRLLRVQFDHLEDNARELSSAADALRASQLALSEKSEVLETTLRYMDQGIIMVTPDRRIAVWNPQAAALLDLPESLLAKNPPMTELTDYQMAAGEFDGEANEFRQGVQKLDRLNEPHLYTRRRPNGLILEVKSTPMPNGGVIRTYTDVTEQRQAAERIAAARDLAESAREAAERANRAKTEFLANMSHEIRTPMNGIVGMNQLLLRSNLSADQREWALGVQQSAESLLEVIDDILDFAKLEAGKIAIEPKDFHLGNTVRAAVGLLELRAAEKHLTLVTSIEPACDRWVFGDAVRVRQVLINLVGNAVKFTEQGGVKVRVMADSSGPDVTAIEVADTGIGMSKAVISRLFQKFSQGDSSISRRFGGSGLGLAISNELTEMMGGRIQVESTEGKGSVFRLILPLPPGEDPGIQPSVEPEPLAQAQTPARSLRVLVTDDNPINLRLLTALLRGGGHTVATAMNGREAIERLEEAEFDAVLMDVQMPIMDGMRATAHIRRMQPPKCDVPIIALTADALRGAADRYRSAGMDGYLSKPLSATALFSTLHELTQHGLRQRITALGAPVLDNDTVEQLRSILKASELDALLTEALADFDARIPRLAACLDAGDLPAAAREAHTFISIAGNCGAAALCTLARDIERACKRDSLEDARRAYGHMDSIAREAVAALTRIRAAVAAENAAA